MKWRGFAIIVKVLLLLGTSNGLSITQSSTTLSYARQFLSGASVGQYAIFAGGRTDFDVADGTVDIFHLPTLLRTNTTLSVPRYAIGVASIGNYALFGGGAGGDYYGKDQVDIFDASTLQWTTARLSEARAYPAVAVVSNYAIFASGGSQGGVYFDAVDMFDSSTGRWTTSKLSSQRVYVAGASAGKYALFAGGFNQNGRSDVVDILDSTTLQWTTTSLPQPVDRLIGLSLGRYAAFLGGKLNDSVSSKQGHIFDSETLQWSTIPINGRFDGSYDCSTTMGQYALICGFTMNETDWTKSLFFLDPSNAWNMTDLNMELRYGTAVTSIGNKALFGGGNALGTRYIISSADVDILEFNSLDIPVQETIPAPSSKTSNASRDFIQVVPLIFGIVFLFSP